MTGENLIDRLGERIEDTGEVNFNATYKTNILNIAQDVMINLLDRRYFPTLASNVTGVSEPFETTTTSLSGWTGRHSDIYKVTTSTGVCEFIDVKDTWKLENEYMKGSTYAPIAFFDRNHIFTSPGVTTIDVFFYTKPVAIAHNSTVYPFEGLESILLDLAESEIWKRDDKLDRSNLAYQRAIDQINLLNKRVEIDSATTD